MTTINLRGQLIDLTQPIVMGILNVTPDSFFAVSRKQTEREIAERANQIVAEGGRIIDVGAFSTRPGADVVSQEEEMLRLRKGLEIVRREQPDAFVSVDTYRPEVARMCREEYGIDLINDISEGGIMGISGVMLEKSSAETPEMFAMAARLKIPYILMSVASDIQTMIETSAKEIALLRSLGVNDIIFDPGFGFGKTLDDNYQIMANLEKLSILDCPLLVGISRKSMMTRLLSIETTEALNATTALHTISLIKGAAILRVHDVKEACQAITIVEKLNAYNKCSNS